MGCANQQEVTTTLRRWDDSRGRLSTLPGRPLPLCYAKLRKLVQNADINGSGLMLDNRVARAALFRKPARAASRQVGALRGNLKYRSAASIAVQSAVIGGAPASARWESAMG